MALDLVLSLIIRLRDRASDGLRDLTRRGKELQDQIERINRVGHQFAAAGAGMAAGGAAILGGVGVTAKTFADTEDAATRLRLALMRSDGGAAAFAEINRQAEELGDRLPGTTADFQRMMTMLIRQGLDAKTILAGTGEAAAYLAVMLEKTPDDAAEFAAKLQDATGTAAQDMVKLADTIQRVFYLGVDPGNMLEAFSALAPGMASIKQKGLAGAQAMAPLIAMLDQSALVGGAAGNALTKIFQDSFDLKKLGKANEILKEFGIALKFTDAKGQFLGLDNLFTQFEKLKKLPETIKLPVIKALYGDDKETKQALDTLMNKGKAGYDEMMAKMQDQADLQSRINSLLGTLKNLWDAASGTFTNLLARLGETISPELKQLTTWFGDLSGRMRAWIDANPQVARTVMLIVASVGVLLSALGGLAVAIGGVLVVMAPLIVAARLGGLMALIRLAPGLGMLGRALAFLITPIRSVGTALLWLGRAVMLHPVIAAVAALAAGAIQLYRNWDRVKAWWPGFWASMKTVAGNAWSAIKTASSIAWAAIKTLAGNAWAAIKTAAVNAWNAVVASAQNLPYRLGYAVGQAVGWVIRQFKALPGWLQSIWTAIVDAAGRAWQAIRSAAADAWAGIKNDAIRYLMDLPGKLLEMGRNAAAGLWQGIKSGANSALDAAKSMGQGVVDGVSNALQVKSPSRVLWQIGRHVAAGLALGLGVGAAPVTAAWEHVLAPLRAPIALPAMPAFQSSAVAAASVQTPALARSLPVDGARLPASRMFSPAVGLTPALPWMAPVSPLRAWPASSLLPAIPPLPQAPVRRLEQHARAVTMNSPTPAAVAPPPTSQDWALRPVRGGGGAGPVTVHFAPVIHVDGSGDAKADIAKALREQIPMLEGMLQRVAEQRGRRAYR